jgi:UPF0716 protein FxsA
MIAALFLLLLLVPIVELWIIVQVSGELGLWATLGVLVLISVAGAWLLKQQGRQTWRRLRVTLSRGQMPTEEVADGALILLGGALLMTPGFLTDAFGILFLLPPSRTLVKGAARRSLGWWAGRRLGTRRGRAGARAGPRAPEKPDAREGRPPVIEAAEVHRSPGSRAGDDSRDRG